MAAQLQLVFSAADEKRNNLAILKKNLKDQLDNNLQFKHLVEEENEIKRKKTQLINQVMHSNVKEIEEIERLTLDLRNQKQLICDIAIRDYLAGDKVEVVDNIGRVMAPVFSVKFVKTGNVVKNNKLKKEASEEEDDDDFFNKK